jgi:hypothetical protein
MQFSHQSADIDFRGKYAQAIASGFQELILNWCWEITDKGVEEVILYCQRIAVLSLVGVVRITESILVNVGDYLPELKYLNMEQCPNIDDTNLVSTPHSSTNSYICNWI